MTVRDIWVLPLEEERQLQSFLQTQFYESSAVFSPDENWLAYVSNESGRFEIYVQPFPGPGGKWQISTEGGREPVWATSGKELFYRSLSGDQMIAVEVQTEPSFNAGTPRLLFEGNYDTSAGTLPYYDVTADGQRFIMIQTAGQETEISQINIVLNCFEELKQRVPVP